MLANVLVRSLKHCVRRFATQTSEQTIRLADVNINYVQSGNGSKNVLLMPGAIGSAWVDFKPQIEKLPDVLPDYNIIAWDPPGYGKSRPPKRHFTSNFYHDDADYAKKLMDIIGKPKFSILGWSDGGITGMILAAKYPEAVEKLVIWGSNSYISDEEAILFEKMRDVSTWSKRMREPLEAIYGIQGFADIWAKWIDAALSIYHERKGNICKEDVPKIQAPTFILHGKKDPMVAAEHIPYLRKHLKDSKFFEFPDGKHNIHLRYADEFNRLIAEFLIDGVDGNK